MISQFFYLEFVMLASKQDILMVKFEICSKFTGLNILPLFKGEKQIFIDIATV